MSLVTSGKLLPGELVEQLLAADSKVLKERPFGPLVLLITAPFDDETGRFVNELEGSVKKAHRVPTEPQAWLSTTEMPTLGVEASEPSEADQVELLAELGSATHVIVPLVPAKEGREIFLGRSPSADVVLVDPSVSANHAVICIEDGGARLRDVESKNGTQLNGQRLESGQARWLQPMDRIGFGRVLAFACDPRALRAVLRQDLKSLF